MIRKMVIRKKFYKRPIRKSLRMRNAKNLRMKVSASKKVPIGVYLNPLKFRPHFFFARKLSCMKIFIIRAQGCVEFKCLQKHFSDLRRLDCANECAKFSIA